MPTKTKQPKTETIEVIKKFLEEKSSEFPSDLDHQSYCHLIDSALGNHTLCLGPVYGMNINDASTIPLATHCPICLQQRCPKCRELYKLMMGLGGHAT